MAKPTCRATNLPRLGELRLQENALKGAHKPCGAVCRATQSGRAHPSTALAAAERCQGGSLEVQGGVPWFESNEQTLSLCFPSQPASVR